MKFLIVDDDPAIRELLRVILSRYAHCDLADDGQQAIDAVRQALDDGQPYDLVCLDIMMPEVDGHEALEGIRQLEAEHGIYGSDGSKVIITTATMDTKHCVRAFKEGCESYCTKPLTEEKLLNHVRDLLGEELRELPRRETTTPVAPAGGAG